MKFDMKKKINVLNEVGIESHEFFAILTISVITWNIF